jgi:hypothetical protein
MVIPDNKDILERLRLFGDLQPECITLKASCFNCISTSCKDEPVRDLANGIRRMVRASGASVHVQLDCIVYGLTYCSFGEFSWAYLDDALVEFSTGRVQVSVLVRFLRGYEETASGSAYIAYTPPGFLNQRLPLSMTRPNINITTEPPTIVVDPDMMYYNHNNRN